LAPEKTHERFLAYDNKRNTDDTDDTDLKGSVKWGALVNPF